jgi:prepilin-type N-terminal cleavage/methylation domain-containing protein
MKKIAKILHGNSGFTIVELLIATGILSVLMLGFSGYMYYQSKMGKMQESKQNYNYVESSILNAAGQEDALIQSEKLQVSDVQ